MNDGESPQSAFEGIQKCAYQFIRNIYCCFKCTPLCSQVSRVYPESLDYEQNKFLIMQPNQIIRIIYHPLETATFGRPISISDFCKCSVWTCSFSKSDYAFTNCSKPLRVNDDSRFPCKNMLQKQKSACYSNVKDCSLDLTGKKCSVPYSYFKKGHKVSICVEEFIESLVQDIIFDSLHIVCSKTRDISDSNYSVDTNIMHKHLENCVELNNHHFGDDNTYLQDCYGAIGSDECHVGSAADSRVKAHAYSNAAFREDEGEGRGERPRDAASLCTHIANKQRCQQRRQRPAVVFLHGVGSGAELWMHQLRHLRARGFDVLAPDMLGHGLSSAPDAPQHYAFPALVQHALRVIDACVAPGRPCALVAHAFGCSLATALARLAPRRVLLLILVSGGGPVPLAPRRIPRAITRRLLRPLLPVLLCCGFSREVVYDVPLGKHIAPAHECAAAQDAGAERAGAERAVAEGAVPPYVLRHFAARAHAWPEGDAAFHRRIAQPTLLVHGMRDCAVSLPQQCDMERTIPRASLELIPDAGHFAMLETPARLSHMIECFIDWWIS